MSPLRDEAVRIVTDFFEVTGPFAENGPEGMSASSYPGVLARFVEERDTELQREIAGVLLTYAMDGTHAFSQASAYVCGDLALRGLAAAFNPHVAEIRKWFEMGNEMGWWTTDSSYETAPLGSKNANLLMNVLWCCDEGTAKEITGVLLRSTSSSQFRASLMRCKLASHRGSAEP
jgi:hypothetical protein